MAMNKYLALSSALSSLGGTARETGAAIEEMQEKKKKRLNLARLGQMVREGIPVEEVAAAAFETENPNLGLPMYQQAAATKQANIAREDTQTEKREAAAAKLLTTQQEGEGAKLQLDNFEKMIDGIKPRDQDEKDLLTMAKGHISSARISMKSGGDYKLGIQEANDILKQLTPSRTAKIEKSKQNQNDSRLANKAVVELQKVENPLREATALKSTFDDSYAGFGAGPLGTVKLEYEKRFGDNTNFVDWWQRYQEQKNKIRNQLFGSALTETERAEFEKAIVSPQMRPEQVKRNLERQEIATKIAASKIARFYLNKGVDRETVDTYASNYGNFDWENYVPPDWYLGKGKRPEEGATGAGSEGAPAATGGAIKYVRDTKTGKLVRQ